MKAYGQNSKVAIIAFTFADFPTGVFTPVPGLPSGAHVIAGGLNITEASNAAGTDTIAFGIAGSHGRNLAATDAKTLGKTAFAALTTVSGETLGVTRTLGGAAGTAGEGYIWVEYFLQDGFDFNVAKIPNPNDANVT